jgi:hypothetical protein
MSRGDHDVAIDKSQRAEAYLKIKGRLGKGRGLGEQEHKRRNLKAGGYMLAGGLPATGGL